MSTKKPTGLDVLRDPARNKASAFTEAERDALGLRGLLPPAVSTPAVQMQRVLGNLRRKTSDIEKYIFLAALQARNERLFYQLAMQHIDEIMPLIYTPTVGQACREFSHIFRRTQGFYISARDVGRMRAMLDNWPERDVRVIVMTDGERILGLGDLGASGMGIPIGKLALYTACAGIRPEQCLPVMFDVGTGNQDYLDDPLYLGLRQPRLRGEAYVALMDEAMAALHDAFPQALIQFEDFATDNAIGLLARYRDRYPCFNDDIQGTAAVTLAGLYAASRLHGKPLAEQTFLFLGAGSAATGIADLIVAALVDEGLPQADAQRRVWMIDSKGLITAGRAMVKSHQRPYAHEHAPGDLGAAVRSLRPDALIGVTGRPGTFTEPALRQMAEQHAQPVVFALSNPTAHAECTAEQAYAWTGGRVIFASGSPFDVVAVGGQQRTPSQANNAYIFPGIGLGALLSGATRITDPMFLAAARVLSAAADEQRLQSGALFPPLGDIRAVSEAIGLQVAEWAWSNGLANLAQPQNVRQAIAEVQYDPSY